MTSRGVDNASRNAIPSQAQENVIEDRASARNSLASRRDRTDNVARRETRVSDQPTIDQPAADQPGNDQATSAQQLANVEAVAPRSAHLPPVDSSITHEARAAQRPLEGTSTPLDPLADESRLQLRTFSAEVRKQAANHFFANTARVTPGSVFEENISLGLYFRASSVMQITAEGGRERYAQRLNVNNGDTIAIDQKPNLLWLGLGLRYLGSEDLFISGMHPYLHMTAGYAFNAGPLVRARIGVRQTIVEGERFGLALTGAFEASSLVYTYNRQALLSGRYGGTFGVEVGAW